MAAELDECLALFGDHLTNHAPDDTYHRELLEMLLEQDFASKEAEEWFYFINITMTIFVIMCVAIFAGLFVGLMTMDAFQLQITERSSLDEDERKYAATLYPIVADRHRLLVTLLILNALAYETLPLFLDKMVPGWLAIVLSTTIVLLFGEIVPSAIFIGYVTLEPAVWK
jgi:Cyclin M transmembrane N-terminal domain